jgi:hypothetical protein
VLEVLLVWTDSCWQPVRAVTDTVGVPALFALGSARLPCSISHGSGKQALHRHAHPFVTAGALFPTSSITLPVAAAHVARLSRHDQSAQADSIAAARVARSSFFARRMSASSFSASLSRTN